MVLRALEIERVEVGRRTNELDQTGAVAPESPVLLGRDDDDSVLAVFGDDLWTVSSSTLNEFAEVLFGCL